MNIPEIESNFREMDDILCAGYAPNVISTAMELGLFDVLFEKPMDTRTLSDRLGTVYEITEAFANVLVALNLLAKDGADYSLAPCRYSEIAVGITPHEHRGSGTPIKLAFITE